jgi:hypothetical protein
MKKNNMPEKKTIARAHKDKEEGKAPSTQAGEFVREEMDHIREGKYGARSTKQAIAIGLSKARRAGVKLPAPRKGKTSEKTREAAKRDLKKGKKAAESKPAAKRSRATRTALQREGRKAASSEALSKQARSAAAKRTKIDRSAAAKKAARTKGPAKRSEAARKAAETRAAES